VEKIGAYEAKTHLPRLLERVSKGEQITITKHGLPVAVLQAPPALKKASPKKTIMELLEFRARHGLKGLSIRQMMEEGRR
jgi:prevent-host-death family protein